MGLDQFLFKTKATLAEIESKEISKEEIAYWRKHPNLQGFMQSIFLEKNEEYEREFNTDNVYLTEEDLDRWEAVAKAQEYPETTGFFFGSNSDDYYLSYDLKTIYLARKALKEGYTVYYTSWW